MNNIKKQSTSLEVSLKGMRGMIAKKMQSSLQDHAQLSYHAEFDATQFLQVRSNYKQQGHAVGYEDLFVSVLAQVLKDHPHMNGTIDDKVATLSEGVHASVAVSIKTGLVAPTIFDAQAKSVTEISQVRRDLIERAEINKLTVPEMVGGTITISNLGTTRIHSFTPIINTPQIAIIGIGCIQQKPLETEKEVVIFKPMITLSLTADHRLIDGAPAGLFLTDLCERLERLE